MSEISVQRSEGGPDTCKSEGEDTSRGSKRTRTITTACNERQGKQTETGAGARM